MDFVGPCTKYDWSSYWCMTKVLSSENIVNTTTDSWGECSLSCLDPNINNDPLITNYKFTADLMNKLKIGTGNQGTNDTISSLKGRISDFYLWDFPLTSEKIQNFVNCEDEDITYNHAKISWQHLQKHWRLNLDGKSLLIYEKQRHQLCQRQEFNRFYGFPEQMNFQHAMRKCGSFGGTLPNPSRLADYFSLHKIFLNQTVII